MSTSVESIYLPKVTRDYTFDSAFAAAGKSAADAKAQEAGPVLSSVARLAMNTGAKLKLGNIRSIMSFGQGRGMRFGYSRSEITYQEIDGITCWEELDPEMKTDDGDVRFQDSATPLFPSRGELVEILKEMKIIGWFGFRRSSNNVWDYHLKSFLTDRKMISQACLGLFQVDLILNTQQYPRSRLCIGFETGRLWLWVTAKNDYMVAFTLRTHSAHQLLQISRFGETFFTTKPEPKT